MNLLEQTVKALSAKGKGILAADESTPTIAKRFASIDVESTVDTRRAYRACLLTTPKLEDYVSGVILYEETLGQKTKDGQSFVSVLNDKGIVPGIKVDQGLVPFESSDEKVTQGLDGLEQRLSDYKAQGARFAKWRAVYQIGETTPTAALIKANAERLASYAKTCQNLEIVPIVEPEVLIDGSHDIQTCAAVTERVLTAVFAALKAQEVDCSHIVLKPSMVIAGKDCPTQASVEEVSQKTLEVFKATVPSEVPTINFLSGGQTPQQATEHLNALNQNANPWQLSFSYGRALQEPCLQAWQGKDENLEKAQQALLLRAKLNSMAVLGQYKVNMESDAA